MANTANQKQKPFNPLAVDQIQRAASNIVKTGTAAGDKIQALMLSVLYYAIKDGNITPAGQALHVLKDAKELKLSSLFPMLAQVGPIIVDDDGTMVYQQNLAIPPECWHDEIETLAYLSTLQRYSTYKKPAVVSFDALEMLEKFEGKLAAIKKHKVKHLHNDFVLEMVRAALDAAQTAAAELAKADLPADDDQQLKDGTNG